MYFKACFCDFPLQNISPVCKQVKKSVDLLRKFQNVLPRTFKVSRVVEIFKMWPFIIFDGKTIIYHKYWCANVEKKNLSTAIFIGNTFSSFSTSKYFLKKSLVTFCFNLRKTSCFINQSMSYFTVKISISEFRVACLCIFFVFFHFQISILYSTLLHENFAAWKFCAFAVEFKKPRN